MISSQRIDEMRSVWQYAKPGTRIKCLRNPCNSDKMPLSAGAVVFDEVYTVRELRTARQENEKGVVGFTVEEIVNDPVDGTEPFFSADIFEILSCTAQQGDDQ